MDTAILLNAVSANGTGPAINTGSVQSNFTIEVTTSGTVAALSVQLQGSVDGVTYGNIGSAITSATAGTSLGTGVLMQYFQAVLSGYSGTGTVTCELAYSLGAGAAGAGGPPTGAAGGILTGTYPNPGITTLNQNTTGTAANITGTLDQVPHAAASVNLNSQKITNLANGSGAQDAVAYGQLGTSAFLPAAPAFTTKSGAYVEGQWTVSTSAALANGTLRLCPLLVTLACTVAQIGMEFTAAGDAASLFRMAIYGDDGTGYPGSLLSDGGSISTGTGNAGTVATGGTPGIYFNTLGTPQALTAGTLVWLGGVVQGVSSVQPTVRVGYFGGFTISNPNNPGTNGSANGYTTTGVTGSFPSSFPVFSSAGVTGSNIPRIVIKLQ